MKFCGKCGTQMEENAVFCPNCGASAGTVNQQPAGYQDPEVLAGKGMSILAYLSILVLIPIFGGGTNRFTRFHANQGLVLFIIEVIFGIISQIFWWSLPYGGLWRFMNMLSGLAGLVFCVASVIGILNAVNGVKKELPLIGKIKILK